MTRLCALFMPTMTAGALLLAGCQTIVSERVEDSLVEAGVPRGMAECMGDIWADDLSIDQIRGIQRFAKSVKAERRQLTAGRLIAHTREWNDLEALGVVTTSTARCAFS
ncbi:MAG: hypothetical protein WBA68_13740 [Alteraurantiacibacter sp.]